ncbi:threonine ammonia-lyase [Nostocoides jenkinsii]|jgi:threonine dehydratase|uniref:threonine ammonia-lyase n=1 Tax=Nostocoides jenkinsii Ben 74 TaxID=1193518 RepID=A0A077M759_9MICO|nr:threonine ammonia-lyase [Tetrasphaera jenkinsii]CCI52379.1 threonine dehydratase [Tetrasphaera jenkinsii Ben 74]
MVTVPTVTLHDVLAAREQLGDLIRPTPMEFSRVLSDRLGTDVYLKCENLQRAGSFKIRGAYTRISRLTEEEKARGVVAASAGNHAQGVALAATTLGIKSKVYMPAGAAMPKLVATRAYGAEVEQVGATLDESLASARAYAEETGAVLIHPFDHPDIVAGQGTCGLEILEQVPEVGTVVVSLGGGGLLAGIATAIKSQRRDVAVVGVQAEEAAAYPMSLAAGRPIAADRMATMADGIAVGLPGAVPFELVRSLVDRVDTVSEAALSRAMLQLLEHNKLVVEPAGAAGVALLNEMPDRAWNGPIVVVLSGGNIDPLLMLRIIRHGMVAAGRYLQFRVVMPDRPGSLARLIADCAAADANVVEVEHLRHDVNLLIDEVDIFVQLETKGQQHCQDVLTSLRAKGYRLKFA